MHPGSGNPGSGLVREEARSLPSPPPIAGLDARMLQLPAGTDYTAAEAGWRTVEFVIQEHASFQARSSPGSWPWALAWQRQCKTRTSMSRLPLDGGRFLRSFPRIDDVWQPLVLGDRIDLTRSGSVDHR